MKKYKLMRGMMFATALSLSTPSVVYASDWKDKAIEAGRKLVEWSSKTDKYVNEKAVDPVKDKLSDVEIYKHDSLWIVTDMPSVSPDEDRHYYFIDKNSPTMKWTFYYDKKGNKVSSNDKVAKSEVREMYVSLTDTDVVFRTEQWLDYNTKTFTVNYIELDEEKLYDEYTTAKYGRFASIDALVPESEQKEKYSTKDLKEILDIINNKDYSLKNDSYGRKK